MNVRSTFREGFLTSVVNIFVVLLGLTGLMGEIIIERLDLSSPEPGAWVVLLGVALVGGMVSARRAESKSWRDAAIVGLLAGGVHGTVMAVFTGLIASLTDAGVELFRWLAQLSADAVQLLTFGRAPLTAAVLMFVAMTVAELGGAVLNFASVRYEWRESVVNWWSGRRAKLLAHPSVQKAAQSERSRYVLYGVGLVMLFAAPFWLGRYWNYTLGTVGLYVILGLGLNIVVGMAGLLDLGYVAFFAIGSYTVAMLIAKAKKPFSIAETLVLPAAEALARAMIGEEESKEILKVRKAVREVGVTVQLQEYVVRLVAATRNRQGVKLAASPRASLSLLRVAQAMTLFEGREFLVPETVQDLAPDVIGHRLVLESDAVYSGWSGEAVVREIIEETAVPV